MVIQLDFEKYQGRVDTSRKKTKRSERDNAYLAKAETELVRAKEVCPLAWDLLASQVLRCPSLPDFGHTVMALHISTMLSRYLTRCRLS